MSFTSIPLLDLSLSRNPDTKPAFLESLRQALLEVGFLYIKNIGIDDTLIQDVMTQGKTFFDLPEEKKLEIQMKNVPSFLGYNKLGAEITKYAVDWREQVDISTPHPRPSPTSPLYYNLRYPNQWPDPTFIPSFRPIIEAYIRQMSTLSVTFTSLIAEALLLPPTAFDRYFDRDQQHKLKIIKYPDTGTLPPSSTSPAKDETEPAQAQGVGPHKDSMLTTYLLQASSHQGLQAQNMTGTWIDCPPIPGTLIVVIGQGLEALTHGICASTTHRVLSPSAGSGPRFSMPFFQGVSYDATFESVDIPPAILAMRDERLRQLSVAGGRIDDVEFTFRKGKFNHLGEATLFNRVKSHPDVGERWYPEILAQTRAEQAAAAVAAAATGREVEAKTEQGGGGAEKDGRETVNGIHPTTATQGSAIQAH